MIMAEFEQKPLLETMLKELDEIKDKWREVGKVLKVSKTTLDERANVINDKENFKIVMKEWLEKNRNSYIWSPLLQALNNIDVDSSVLERLRKAYCCIEDSQNSGDGDMDRAGEDESDLHRGADDHDDNRHGKCQRLTRCCCFPCRITCCRNSKYFKKSIAIGKCLVRVLMLPMALAIIVQVVRLRDSKGIDELDRLLMEDQTAADRLLEVGVRPIRILVTGKTGTGKSSLINGLIGDNVTEEGSSLDPTTTKVEQFNRTVRGVPMLVFDSPGLQDGTENEKDYLLDMERNCKKVDLVLYTMKMTDKRLHPEDVEAMKKLTNAFGEKFWESSVFVMTFANEVRNPEKPDDEDENRIYFEKTLDKWKKKLPVIVEKELNVSKKVARRIPVVPAGYYKNIHLPGRRYWFSQFWKSALDRMKEFSDDGYSFMLHFNKDRFRRAYEITPEELTKDLHEQPIVWNSPPSSSSASALKVAYTTLVFYLVLLVFHY